MNTKAGRNDPCPCGSGKKHKHCCWGKEVAPRRLNAKWINQPTQKMPNLLERTFGAAVQHEEDKPPTPPSYDSKEKKEESDKSS